MFVCESVGRSFEADVMACVSGVEVVVGCSEVVSVNVISSSDVSGYSAAGRSRSD